MHLLQISGTYLIFVEVSIIQTVAESYNSLLGSKFHIFKSLVLKLTLNRGSTSKGVLQCNKI